jgi:hypothetical protein
LVRVRQWLLHGVRRIARLRDADPIVDGEKLREEARRGYAETRKKRLEIKIMEEQTQQEARLRKAEQK